MKTKNNVQKAILKSLAVIISLVLISFTVSAQNFWRTLLENETFSEIAYAMTESSDASSASEDASGSNDADMNAHYAVLETEEALELEDWMTNENNFVGTFITTQEMETPMELENWMTDETLFFAEAINIEIEIEEELEMEDWMTNESTFETENETDSKLVLENWMTSQVIWKN